MTKIPQEMGFCKGIKITEGVRHPLLCKAQGGTPLTRPLQIPRRPVGDVGSLESSRVWNLMAPLYLVLTSLAESEALLKFIELLLALMMSLRCVLCF